jgi:hypothetical protein
VRHEAFWLAEEARSLSYVIVKELVVEHERRPKRGLAPEKK